MVVPRVGAWIETFDGRFVFREKKVVPRVGAWIETPKNTLMPTIPTAVVPRVGAWIETL